MSRDRKMMEHLKNRKIMADFLQGKTLKDTTKTKEGKLIKKTVLPSGMFGERYFNRYKVMKCIKCGKEFVTMKNNRLGLCFPTGWHEKDPKKVENCCKIKYQKYQVQYKYQEKEALKQLVNKFFEERTK